MGPYNFTLIISGPVDEHLDELFEAGCNDALFGEVDGVHYAEFDREAPAFRQAITSAMRAVNSVDELRVERIEPEDLVTASDIAARLGRTRESIRLLIAGDRGPGGFPAPVSHLRDRNRLWRWGQVLIWWAMMGEPLGDERHEDALFIAAVNAALEWHRQRAQLQDEDADLVAEAIA
jgi:hypothetical protein